MLGLNLLAIIVLIILMGKSKGLPGSVKIFFAGKQAHPVQN
jgi:hypothetical protein